MGRHHVHPKEGQPPRASGNPQQEPGEPATVEEPSGMLGITHVQSSSSAIPPPGRGLTLPEGRQIPPPDISTGRQQMSPGKGQPMLLSSPSGPVHSSSGKEPPSPPSLPWLRAFSREGCYRRNFGLPSHFFSDCSSKPLKAYTSDVRCDAGRVSEDTSCLLYTSDAADD